ncbi:hypothetical protein LHK_01297 [Laribacter hongkongensis HLHK9]|uniref:Uncharacterized protein n=1 Tax=Laribacter hongkongensis (strain HLHK9) TaxID=557598 RepID=C1D747_LARHH|nr:hypothetical protein LHK_01297 [Laribacter hongkongensis HLHK9]
MISIVPALSCMCPEQSEILHLWTLSGLAGQAFGPDRHVWTHDGYGPVSGFMNFCSE